VETPEETPNLHEIYSGWMKLYSLAQDAKQEAEAHLKKNGIKPEPATSEEEDVADAKLNNITQENHVDAKPPAESRTDVKESAEVLSEEREEESVSEQLLPPAAETQTTDPESEEGEKKEEETIAEEQSAPVEEAPEAAGEEVEPRAAICDQPDAALTPGEEQRETQESEAATDEASALEQTAVNQTEASEEGEGSAAEQTEPDTTEAQETKEQQDEAEATPPADPVSENPQEEVEETSKGRKQRGGSMRSVQLEQRRLEYELCEEQGGQALTWSLYASRWTVRTSSSNESLKPATSSLHGAEFGSEPWGRAGVGDGTGFERGQSIKGERCVVTGYQDGDLASPLTAEVQTKSPEDPDTEAEKATMEEQVEPEVFIILTEDEEAVTPKKRKKRKSKTDADTPAEETPSPDAFTPDTATPDTATPDTATPDTATPDTATPDTATPDTATPDTATPDTATPDT
ncbi:hypothetical protein JOQ06_024411, partial [Pogonophryne albipinna]